MLPLADTLVDTDQQLLQGEHRASPFHNPPCPLQSSVNQVSQDHPAIDQVIFQVATVGAVGCAHPHSAIANNGNLKPFSNIAK
ncbi:hypothetical protein AJ78_06684 [Emergomyces pasteurianus Ep9510]|uniref:Uncharacterized protein n=1 Tax=Emergomyces pasteurianus Ep9510 TaxID=1447872 RepID=A0A1J9Q9A7_9EURO|nr:hypothetical protein AJ78_06684 [Emergomyces pasteurianus Ep9510]